MRLYLVFRLYGPMASWGDIAVGEYRPSFFHPTKSAIIGLLEAALGIDRSDEQAHRKMTRSYGFAVQVHAPGSLVRDYHTVQVPPSSKKAFYFTRKHELEAEKIGTVLSYRDYYCDALSFPCVWTKEDPPPYALAEIEAALNCPHYPLYMGRKSCPAALPLAPRVIGAPTLLEAFGQFAAQDSTSKFDLLRGLPKGEFIALYWEELPESEVGCTIDRTLKRRDMPLNRRAWQFRDRKEHSATLSR